MLKLLSRPIQWNLAYFLTEIGKMISPSSDSIPIISTYLKGNLLKVKITFKHIFRDLMMLKRISPALRLASRNMSR